MAKSEYFRNVHKIVMIDHSDVRIYQFSKLIKHNLNNLLIRMMNLDNYLETGENEDGDYNLLISELEYIIADMYNALTHQNIGIGTSNNYPFIEVKGAHSINTVVQDIFTTLKIQDELFAMIIKHELLFKKLLLEQSNDNHYFRLVQVFQGIFQVLSAIIRKNNKAQQTMWRYKHIIVLENIEDLEGLGELQLINQLVENTELLENSKDLPEFFSKLNERFSKKNIEILLSIYSRVSKVTTSTEIK